MTPETYQRSNISDVLVVSIYALRYPAFCWHRLRAIATSLRPQPFAHTLSPPRRCGASDRHPQEEMLPGAVRCAHAPVDKCRLGRPALTSSGGRHVIIHAPSRFEAASMEARDL